MCGIVGVVMKKGRINERQLLRASDSIHHRGPNHNANWISGHKKVAFAHQRLSIIDTRSCSHQPFQYAERYVIIYNGEIYNYLELKKSLKAKGFSFNTESDTEVVAAAYQAYGKDCVHHFDGAFAFAIWDEVEQKLFAARDRFGEKPFFYYLDNEKLLFASEMKALWKAGAPTDVNRAMLYNFFTVGYTANPGNPEETFYQFIFKLPAASFLEYDLAGNIRVLEKYWQPELKERSDVSEAEAIEQFKQMLTESVRKRLRSDVAIGTSLSGGLDSSTIVALCAAQKETGQYSHKCFTAAFPHFDKDEREQAARVAEKFCLQHIIVTVTEGDLLQQMDELMYHQEEPVGSASSLAQYKVYEAAKANGVTVLLDGQGADEILAGYHKYYKWYWQELYRQKTLSKSGELKAARRLGVQEPFTIKNKMAALFPEFAAAMLQTGKAKNAAKLPGFDANFARSYKKSLYYSLPTYPDLNGTLFYNTFVNGLEDLLRMADRNSMAHGVEVRLPFLNHQMVEFLFTLPPNYKIHKGWTKWLLRKSMEDELPKEIVWRKDKVGFEPPQLKWMHNPAIKERIISSKKILVEQGILSAKAQQHYQPHSANSTDAFDWRCWTASYLFRH